jgi:hypothetical protein
VEPAAIVDFIRLFGKIENLRAVVGGVVALASPVKKRTNERVAARRDRGSVD